MGRFTPWLVGLLVAMLVLSGLPPEGFVGTAGAASVTIGVESALDGTPKTSEVTVTVTAVENGTVDVGPASASRDEGRVTFEFEGWTDLDSSASGADSGWTVRRGHRYRITYLVTVDGDVREGTYGTDVGFTGPVDDSQKRVEATIEVREPQFGAFQTQRFQAVFEGDGTKTVTQTVEIRNVGDGTMRLAEITAEQSPDGISVSGVDLPNQIPADETAEATVEFSIEQSVDPGTRSMSVAAVDNLGNSRSFDVEIEVIKPPRPEVPDGEIDVGDVVVGREASTTFEIAETNGLAGLDGVTAEVTERETAGTLRFDGLGGVSTEPGGSDTATAVVSASNDAEQHETLQWAVRLTPANDERTSSSVEITANVVYPPYYGNIELQDGTILFDEPRSEVTTFTETVEVTIPNDGDLDMNVQSVQASTSSQYLSASVVDRPSTVPGREERTAEIQLRADADAPETTDEVTVTVEAENAGGEEVSRSVEIRHEPRLAVSQSTIEYGSTIITRSATQSTVISETLGYEDISNLRVRKVSGPDRWLEITERPSGRLRAGSDASLIARLTFDTNAELFRQYNWTYEVSGDGVETRTVIVRARAKPFSFERVREPLTEVEQRGRWQRATAGPMVDVLDRLEQRLRNGENVSDDDISTALASARSTTLFVESVTRANRTIADEGHEAAQVDVVRAAAAYNSMNVHASSFDSSRLRSTSKEAVAGADQRISELLSEQAGYYRSRLDSNNTTLRERAQINRRLARLAFLRGDRERAATLRTRSEQAFDDYTALVEEGNEQRRVARERRQAIRTSTVTVLFGQWLVLNPADWSQFQQQSEALLTKYDSATETFSQAGAVQEEQSVRATRAAVAADVRTARYSLYGTTGLYVLVFVGVVTHLTLGVYRYVRDSRERVRGDFLLDYSSER